MDRYGVRDVERLLGLARSTLRSLVKNGFVTPARGPRNSWRFSFQDLVVLRKAQALVRSRVPQRQIVKALRETRRLAEAGQESLPFGDAVGELGHGLARGESLEESINRGYDLHASGRLPEAETVYREARRVHGEDAMLLFNLGVLLEDMKRRDEAMRAYEAALARDDTFADAHYNLALLCNTSGRRNEAIRHMARYRELAR